MRTQTAALLSILLLLCSCQKQIREPISTPNVIYIMADDLGYGDLGCYGQQQLKTPRIDQFARQGIRFTDHYSGHTVCRPSRLVLWTGMHYGHTALQSNAYYRFEGGEQTVVQMLKEAGYATAGCGKWAMGRQNAPGHPNKKGFDDWFGYLDQGDAHNYYPTHLWHNDQKVLLPGNVTAGNKGRDSYYSVEKTTYSHDAIVDWMFQWIRDHADSPFLMHAHLTIPHANNELGYAFGDGMEVPGREAFADRGWPPAEIGFAAMIARLDRDVGRLLDLLDEIGIAQNTLVIFTSDNGPHSEGGHKHSYFDSNGPFRGFKRDLLEGGIRVPFIARWPGVIEPHTTSSHISGFQDFLPTACQLAGIPEPRGIDGLSYFPTLRGEAGAQQQHEHLYWRFKKQEAIRKGRWKLHRDEPGSEPRLHDLVVDPAEENDISGENPEVTRQLIEEIDLILGQSQ